MVLFVCQRWHSRQLPHSGYKRIPVKVGLKFFPVANLYVQGDAGVSLLTNKADFIKGNTVAFTFSPQIGYLFELGSNSNIDVSSNYQNTGKQYDQGATTDYIGFRLLYSYRF